MPAYTTIEYSFERGNLNKTLVNDFYKSIQSNGVKFDKVFAWGCKENMSLNEIIYWNQEKLNSNFKLGYSEDVSNDYRQILLKGTLYSECRLIISNYGDLISFRLIIPESEIIDYGIEIIKEVSLTIVEHLPIYVIQSYGELSDSTTLKELQRGLKPVIEHFGYINKKMFSSQPQYCVKNLSDGCFITIEL